MKEVYYWVGLVFVWAYAFIVIAIPIIWLMVNDYLKFKLSRTGFGYRYYDIKWDPTLKDKEGNVVIDIRCTEEEFPSLRYFNIKKIPYLNLWAISPKKFILG